MVWLFLFLPAGFYSSMCVLELCNTPRCTPLCVLDLLHTDAQRFILCIESFVCVICALLCAGVKQGSQPVAEDCR